MAEPAQDAQAGRPVLEIVDALMSYRVRGTGLGRRTTQVRAVDVVSISVRPRETLGVVGESGCGKSTLAKLALGLEQPDEGGIRIHDRAIGDTDRRWRSGVIQMVMQDPYASLNPRMTVFDIVGEAYLQHGRPKGPRRRELVLDMLRQVGLA